MSDTSPEIPQIGLTDPQSNSPDSADSSTLMAWEFPELEYSLPQEFSSLAEIEISEIKNFNFENEFGIQEKTLEQIQQEAAERGFEEGYATGKETATLEVTQLLEEHYQSLWKDRLNQLEQFIQQFASPIENIGEHVEQALLTLVQTLAERLVRQKFIQDPESLLNLIQSLKDELGHTQHLHIYVSPQDAEVLQTLLPQHLSATLTPDPSLNPGDVRLQTDSAELRAILNERAEQLLKL